VWAGTSGWLEGGTVVANPLFTGAAADILAWDLAYRNANQSVNWARDLVSSENTCDRMRSLVKRYREQLGPLRFCCSLSLCSYEGKSR